jgi:hypothetical protein
MYNPAHYEKRSPKVIYVITGINSLAIFLAGALLPSSVLYVGLLFGFYFYYMTYYAPANNIVWREIRLFIVAITGVSLGLLLLWVSCSFIGMTVCVPPNNFYAQIFISYLYSLSCLCFSWLFYRLPTFIKEIKAKLSSSRVSDNTEN